MDKLATRERTNIKSTLLHYLKYGEENAIRKIDLAKLCEINERQMRLVIRELIDDGIPICGSPHPPYGYYIARNTEELKTEMNLIRNGYGMELLRRYSALRKCLRTMESTLPVIDNGQIRML